MSVYMRESVIRHSGELQYVSFRIKSSFNFLFVQVLSKFLPEQPDASGQNPKFAFFLTATRDYKTAFCRMSIRSNSHFHCIFTSLNCEEAATKWVEANGG